MTTTEDAFPAMVISIGIGIDLITVVLSYHHNNGHIGEDPTVGIKKTSGLLQYHQSL